MKRSDWIQEIAREANRRSVLPVNVELFIPAATMAADALTAAGMRWDPEEEPLPEKLEWYGGAMTEEVGERAPRSVAVPMLCTSRNVSILKAALKAYNEIGGLRERLQKATEAERPSLDERRVTAAEVLLWKQKYASLHERAERTRQRADRFQGVIERAIEHMEVVSPTRPTWFSDLLAILKEEKA